MLNRTFVRRVILLLAACYCFNGVIVSIKASRQYHQIADWPVAQAFIRYSAVVSTNSYVFLRARNSCPRFNYEYTVQSRAYSEYNRTLDFRCLPDAYYFTREHPAGTYISIAYDPANPSVSIVPVTVQDPGRSWGNILGGSVVLVLFLLDMFGTWKPEESSKN